MIWKGTNIPAGTTHNVGFGFHCGTVLAWYCPNKPKTTNLREILLNVCKDDGSCADSEYICTKDGYDSCYNEMAAAAHNAKRTLHCADEPMTVDVAMAKALQGMLNNKQAPTVKAERDALYKDCFENFYAGVAPATEAQVRETNLATEDWYASKARYDFDTGLGNPAFVAKQFTAIVWKGVAPDNKFKVAFARKFNYVIAWYCPAGSTGINAGSYLTNVARDTCPKKCKDDLANDQFLKCYQDVAAAEHNARRKEHLVPALTIDYDLAKQAQTHAQTYAGASGTRPPQRTKNCYLNYWKANVLASAADGKQATAYWYDMIRDYDFSKNIMQPAAAPFTALIWRSSTKVGFGVSGTHVVALYCDTRGNDEGRFACNVCKKSVGCDAAACPMPKTVCSSTDGQGNAEISLTADKASMRIIATVKRGQAFSLALGKASLVDSDLLVFTAGTTAALSTVEDSRASQSGVRPVAEA
jgi:hypothetical protein